MKKRTSIYDLNDMIKKPPGRAMVWVYLVWCYYDGKAELRAVASDKTRAEQYSKMFRNEFKFGHRQGGRIQVRIDEVEVDHGMGCSMLSLTSLDLDPKLQENREKYLRQMRDNEQRTKDYLAMVKKKAEDRGILS